MGQIERERERERENDVPHRLINSTITTARCSTRCVNHHPLAALPYLTVAPLSPSSELHHRFNQYRDSQSQSLQISLHQNLITNSIKSIQNISTDLSRTVKPNQTNSFSYSVSLFQSELVSHTRFLSLSPTHSLSQTNSLFLSLSQIHPLGIWVFLQSPLF